MRYILNSRGKFDDLEQEVPRAVEPGASPSDVLYCWNNRFVNGNPQKREDWIDIDFCRYLAGNTRHYDETVSTFEVTARWASAHVKPIFEVGHLRIQFDAFVKIHKAWEEASRQLQKQSYDLHHSLSYTLHQKAEIRLSCEWRRNKIAKQLCPAYAEGPLARLATRVMTDPWWALRLP